MVRLLLLFGVLLLPLVSVADIGSQETTTPELIRARYALTAVKILLVPGHDLDHSGAVFGKGKDAYKESELTLELAYLLREYLETDPHIDVLVSRNKAGDYSDWLKEYIEDHGQEVLAFRVEHSAKKNIALASGAFVATTTVPHNTADTDTATYLFAINKYANDHGIDLVLHIHLNDHGGRPKGEIGDYTGFTIYTPDRQFSNARASAEIAGYIRDTIGTFFSGSTYSKESAVVVEDQELIATGSNGTRRGASLLIEYGYIYEPLMRATALRSIGLREYAYQTYLGIEKFFNKDFRPRQKFGTTLLPHAWGKDIKKGKRDSRDVLALQVALVKQGFYPPTPRTFADCPLSGFFGDCTEDALVNFQEKKLGFATGFFGPQTRKKLNTFYLK